MKDRQLIQDVKDGYCRMRSLPQSDPRSLLSQTWLHDYYCGGTGGTDLHHTWGFLPWHRAFLYFHEQILGHLIGKPDSFRLPYWDWDRPGHGQIPPFFINLGLPTFLINSSARLTLGPSPTWADPCVLQAWLLSKGFTDFAGQETADGVPGLAVNGAHGMAHAFVGGAMRNPGTAAGDPLFYAHHGNVDRFWDYWQKRYAEFKPPGNWYNQKFYFHDANCKIVEVTPKDVEKIEQLGYSYDHAPSTPLCPFDVVNFELGDLLSPSRLISDLKHLLLGGLLATRSSAMPDVENYMNGTIDYADILGRGCLQSLPVQTFLPLPTKGLEAGKYYVVGLARPPLDMNRATFRKIGGFGVFASKKHLGMEDELKVIATGCLDPTLFSALMKAPQELVLTYGVSTNGTNPDAALLPVTTSDWSIKVLSPQDYIDSAKKFLNNFSRLL